MENPDKRTSVGEGAIYDAPDLRISFSYWTFKEPPSYIRARGITSPQELVLVCPESEQTRIFRTRIGLRKAVVQRCPETGASNFRYLYYVNFPNLNVFDGETSGPGTFTLVVNYDNKSYLEFASRIAHSLKFRSKLANN